MSTPPFLYQFMLASPWDADEVFLRKDLNAQRALGRVLDKPAWWTAWTATYSGNAVRTQWLRELDDFLVRLHVTQALSVWQPSAAWDASLGSRLCDAVVLANGSQAKQDATDAVFNEMVATMLVAGRFRIGLDDSRDSDAPSDRGDEPEWDDSVELTDDDNDNEGDDDSEDDDMLDDDGNIVSFEIASQQAQQWFSERGFANDDDESMGDDDEHSDGDADDSAAAGHDRVDPFGQVGWLAHLLMVRERLLALPPHETTSATITQLLESQPNQATVDHACALILDVLDGRDETGTSIETASAVAARLPVSLPAPTLKGVQLYFHAIQAQLDETKDDVATTLDILVESLVLDGGPQKLADIGGLNVPGPVMRTWLSDTCVSTELRNTLTAELERLRRSVTDDQASIAGVRDLVDPSLFCAVANRTAYVRRDAVHLQPVEGSPAEHMRALMNAATAAARTTKPLSRRTSCQYQWLPSDVDIDRDTGNATIRSYINNLHPETFARLYDALADLVTQFVPLFENVMSSLDSDADARTLHALYTNCHGTLPRAPKLVPRGLFEARAPVQSLRGTRCHIIVRIRELQLTPACPTFDGDAWHAEGTDDEQIIATGVYMYRIENVRGCQLAMRTFVKYPFYRPDDDVTLGLVYGFQRTQELVQELGHVTAVEHRCLVFPNRYQYKLEPCRLADPTMPGMVGMLSFLLVAPMAETPLLSTAVVPPQQADWVQHARDPLVARLGLPETAETLIRAFARDGMDVADAQRHAQPCRAERTRLSTNADYVWYHQSDESKYFWKTGKRPW